MGLIFLRVWWVNFRGRLTEVMLRVSDSVFLENKAGPHPVQFGPILPENVDIKVLHWYGNELRV